MKPDTPREIKERDVCVGCSLFATKPKSNFNQNDFGERLANRIAHLRHLRSSGYPRTESEMTSAEFEGLKLLADIVEQYEIMIAKSPAEMLKAIFAGK